MVQGGHLTVPEERLHFCHVSGLNLLKAVSFYTRPGTALIKTQGSITVANMQHPYQCFSWSPF